MEGSDVFYDSNGYTYSKFYSSVRFIDDQVHWVSTSGGDVHVSMVYIRILRKCLSILTDLLM